MTITLAMYRKAFGEGGRLAAKNWPVFASLFAYSAILGLAATLAAPLGMAGGIVLGLVSAAVGGSFLYLVEQIVRTRKVTLEDFKRSFGPYLWDVMGVYFVLWIVRIAVVPALATLPQGGVILLGAQIAGFVFFNAVPELIYFGHHSSVALFAESYRFIGENWIEWFPANIALAALFYGLMQAPDGSQALYYAKLAAMALFAYFAMVVRGLLFAELFGSTRRSRAFRRRAG